MFTRLSPLQLLQLDCHPTEWPKAFSPTMVCCGGYFPPSVPSDNYMPYLNHNCFIYPKRRAVLCDDLCLENGRSLLQATVCEPLHSSCRTCDLVRTSQKHWFRNIPVQKTDSHKLTSSFPSHSGTSSPDRERGNNAAPNPNTKFVEHRIVWFTRNPFEVMGGVRLQFFRGILSNFIAFLFGNMTPLRTAAALGVNPLEMQGMIVILGLGWTPMHHSD